MAKKEWAGKMETKPVKAPPQLVELEAEALPEAESPPPSIEPIGEDAPIGDFPDIDLTGYDTAGEPIGNSAPIGEAATPPGCLTREQFYRGVFRPLFDMPGAIFRLQSLPIAAHEEPAAQEASNAVYDIALEVPLFRFLIQPGNIWIQRAVVIGTFTVPKAMALKAELEVRRMKMADIPKGQKHEEGANSSGGE